MNPKQKKYEENDTLAYHKLLKTCDKSKEGLDLTDA